MWKRKVWPIVIGAAAVGVVAYLGYNYWNSSHQSTPSTSTPQSVTSVSKPGVVWKAFDRQVSSSNLADTVDSALSHGSSARADTSESVDGFRHIEHSAIVSSEEAITPVAVLGFTDAVAAAAVADTDSLPQLTPVAISAEHVVRSQHTDVSGVSVAEKDRIESSAAATEQPIAVVAVGDASAAVDLPPVVAAAAADSDRSAAASVVAETSAVAAAAGASSVASSLSNADTDASTAVRPLRIMTYNVLADSYAYSSRYSYCPAERLDWAGRKAAVLGQILSTDADVVCLQVRRCALPRHCDVMSALFAVNA